MAIRTFGLNNGDREQRLDIDRLLSARLACLRAALEQSDLGDVRSATRGTQSHLNTTAGRGEA